MSLLRNALCALCLLSIACMNVRPWREVVPPWNNEQLGEAPEVRVTSLDGTTLVLRDVELRGDVLQGRLSGEISDERLTFELAEIERLELRRLEALRMVGNAGLGALATIALTFLLVVAAFG